MVGVVVASHGGFAGELIKSAELIVGKQENIVGLSLNPEDDPQELKKRMGKAVEEVDSGGGVIILVDLLGGSPGNVGAYFAKEGIPVITGVNLPMLLELLVMRDGHVEELAGHIVEAGIEGIGDLRVFLRG